jgi:hypothetical protein
MANHALFIGWNRAVPGREAHAVELFGKLLGFLGKQQQSGGIESFEPVLLESHGGDLNGFCLIRGESDKLERLRLSDEFREIITHAVIHVGNMGVIPGFLGAGLQDQMARFGRAIPK